MLAAALSGVVGGASGVLQIPPAKLYAERLASLRIVSSKYAGILKHTGCDKNSYRVTVVNCVDQGYTGIACCTYLRLLVQY